ncbi:hypothetical protein [Deinococcus hopiensis]|uniref:Uncharacterized protein n=1 Tax=Deinococcus hopiensis KR-140 TaxID=695939 RepID=A0A1W1VNS5_9DEIO|nr:hypothetical protein [Deinococcus hopiensis]SMB94711.1 hypothetical protein SAMN00790413_02498 [Deinococcus hopiensis KR-140]
MKSWAGLLAAFALSAFPPAAQTAAAPPLTLTQQAKKAEVIVRGTLGPSRQVKEGEVSWLVYPLTITETIAGDVATLPQLEGKPALYLLDSVEGLPTLRADQEAFFLLYARRQDSPFVGFGQGVYPVENGRVTRLDQEGLAVTSTPVPPSSTPSPTPIPAAPGTAGTPPAGPALSGTPGAQTAPGTAGTGTDAGSSTPNGTATAGGAATPTPTPPENPLADPGKFRDALRAAREAK